MGGAVSSGRDNDDLVDNLIDADYIVTKQTEKVFRTVDRAWYITEHNSASAYKDAAWRSGKFHLSAPCIYSKVIESLKLEAGQSFLNLGSGTGYLSTMVGLILGSRGINHGVEIHPDVIEYAEQKLEDFIRHCPSFDEFDFCPPIFTAGNFLKLNPSAFKYDRIYCGAGCTEDALYYIKMFLKVGGIAIAPCGDQVKNKLLRIKRIDESDFKMKSIHSVAFASMLPLKDEDQPIDLPDIEVPKLKELCRTYIRALIRKNIQVWKGELDMRRKKNENTIPMASRAVRLVPHVIRAQGRVNNEDPYQPVRGMMLQIFPLIQAHGQDTGEDGRSEHFEGPSQDHAHSSQEAPQSSLSTPQVVDSQENPKMEDMEMTQCDHNESEQGSSTPTAESATHQKTDQLSADSGVSLGTSSDGSQTEKCYEDKDSVEDSCLPNRFPGASSSDGGQSEKFSEDKDYVEHPCLPYKLPEANADSPKRSLSEATSDGETDSDASTKRFCCFQMSPCHAPDRCEMSTSPDQCETSASPDQCKISDSQDQFERPPAAQEFEIPNQLEHESGDSSSDESENEAGRVGLVRHGPEHRAIIRAMDSLSPGVKYSTEEEDKERLHNLQKAKLYHTSFAESMTLRIRSLPLPFSLKDYLLFYRKSV